MQAKTPLKDGKRPVRDVLNIPMYSARVIDNIKNDEHDPGAWDYLNVGVFEGDKQVGSYVRHYHCMYDTFYPFEHDGKWYALVSLDYTRTQLMELPSCKIIGGEPETPGGNGFCPVEFYVPNYIKIKYPGLNDGEWCYDAQIDKERIEKSREIEFHHFKFGLVAGCVWGDEWSWKIQHLDLSRVAEGIITRSEKFGYVWLGNGTKLADAVNIDMEDPDDYRVRLSIEKTYDVSPGSKKDYSKYSTDKDG